MLSSVKNVIPDLEDAREVVSDLGEGSVRLAKKLGTRGLVGLAIAGVAVAGSVVLVRYLRARSNEEPVDAGGTDDALADAPKKKKPRAQRRRQRNQARA